MNTDRDVEQFLVENETIQKSFKLRDCIVYASNKRLIVKKGRAVTDYDYGHISSITFEEERFYVVIIPGIVFVILGILGTMYWDSLSFIGLLFIAIGVFMIVGAIVAKREHLDITVVGLTSPIKFMGERSQLDSLLKLIRSKKQKEEPITD